MDGNSFPHISYYDENNEDLKYAHRDVSGWHLETVDSTGYVGLYTSLGLDESGYPHISYYDVVNDDLKYTHREGTANWHIGTVDSTGQVGYFTSLALDGNGDSHISYFDDTNYDLKYAYRDGYIWKIETVDSRGQVGYFISLAMDSSGYPHISYFDTTNDDLKYAYRDAVGWYSETVDSRGEIGEYTSLALDESGHPHISYFDDTNYDLKYAYRNASGWHSETVDSEVYDVYTSLVLDGNDYPHISYYGSGDLKYAYLNGADWHTQTVDTELGHGSGYTSLVLDGNGYPHISYYDASNSSLKYAYRDSFGWHVETVDNTGGVGKYTSLVLDGRGYPHISYYDAYNYDLKYTYQDGGAVWYLHAVDCEGNVGSHTSLALDGSGYPHISYFDATNSALKYAWQVGDELAQPFTGTISPVYPTTHTDTSSVMQGGAAYRYLRVTTLEGEPISNALITLSSGEAVISNASGYFTATITADNLGGQGNYSVNVQTVAYDDQVYSTGGQPSFPVQVTERRYSNSWSYGASVKAKGGIAAGGDIYIHGKNNGGMALVLDESDAGADEDDVVLMKSQFSDEVGLGAGVGWEPVDVDAVILKAQASASAAAEFALRTFGSSTAKFSNPYADTEREIQGTYLLLSILDAQSHAMPSVPQVVQLAKLGLDNTVYQDYISKKQAGIGVRSTPLKAGVGAEVKLGLETGEGRRHLAQGGSGLNWEKRILGFDLVDLGVDVLVLNTFTDYQERNEFGLGIENEFDLELSALSLEVGGFRDKLIGVISGRAKKIGLEIILDADTTELKRLELALTGEGNPYIFTDVPKEEVTVKTIIPAEQLTQDVLDQTVNVLHLLEAAQETGGNPLRIGPSAMVSELNALLAPLDYVEYEITLDDGAETKYEPGLGLELGLKIDLGSGLKVKEVRSMVRERGVFINGQPYRLESYEADGYVSQPGKEWDELTTNALSGLWLLVKDAFSWTRQKVEAGVSWGVETVSKALDGIIKGGARIIAPGGTQLYAMDSSSHGATVQQTDAVTVTAMGWVPTSTVSASSMDLSLAAATAAGEDFVVGGIYQFRPYTLTLEPAATLVITYTDDAAAEVDESRLGMFRWNPEGSNWQPMAAVSDTVHNAFTGTVTQLGTFAVGYDAVSPEISILAPENGSTISNTFPLISALAMDEGAGIDPDTVEMELNGLPVPADYITCTGQLAYLPSESLASGAYTVTVSAMDVVGNASSTSTTFTVETMQQVYLPVLLRNK